MAEISDGPDQAAYLVAQQEAVDAMLQQVGQGSIAFAKVGIAHACCMCPVGGSKRCAVDVECTRKKVHAVLQPVGQGSIVFADVGIVLVSGMWAGKGAGGKVGSQYAQRTSVHSNFAHTFCALTRNSNLKWSCSPALGLFTGSTADLS
eukprot:1160264-Pelagomonas_calceolata.AAC.4